MNKKQLEKFFKNDMMQEIDKMHIPKGFKKWVDKTVFKESFRMLVTKIAPKTYMGQCQYCKSTNIQLNNISYGQYIKCPNCNHSVQIKNLKYSTFYDREYVYLLNKCSTGYCLELYRCYRQSHGIDYTIDINSVERCFFDIYNEYPLIEKEYPSRWFHITSDGTWQNNRYSNMGYSLPYYNYTYTSNLKYLNNIEKFKYAPIFEYCRLMKDNCFIPKFLYCYEKYPCLEYFVKLKMSNMVKYLLGTYGSKDFIFNWKAKDLKDILCLNKKSNLQYAIKNNLDKDEIVALQLLERANINPSKENINCALKIKFLNEEALMLFGFEGAKKYFMPRYENNNWIISDYNDYFRNCLKLKRDMTNTQYLKPYDFKTAHDQSVNLVKSIETKELDSKTRKVLKRYVKLTYTDEKYCVVVPKSAKDIREEGKNMKNCVGGYVDRVAKGESIICFVRHLSDMKKSFYTLELNPKNLKIVQCRGYHNEKTPEERQVQSFVKKWQKEIVLKKLKAVM